MELKLNNQCYRFEKIRNNITSNNTGIFNDCIDATYIIHLENNGRLNHIYEQLDKYTPSSNIYILFNKGYKICQKKIEIQDTKSDLFDSFLQIFFHSESNNYKNILILEDDFAFSDKVNDKTVVTDICNFINNKSNQKEKFHYKLGSIPYLKTFHNNHQFNIISFASHASIYSQELIKFIVKKDNYKHLGHWDFYLIQLIFENVYTYSYKIPLCYQLFPLTENRKNWTTSSLFNDMIDILIKSLKLDKQYEPGFRYLYNFSFYFSSLIFVFIFYFFLKLIVYALTFLNIKYKYKNKNTSILSNKNIKI